MDITIPGDGFCGTHALFLRMLMTLYTRDATLTKLQSALEALSAIGVAHKNDPYNKPGMIEALQPIVSAFPLKQQIDDAQANQEMSADQVLERAISFTQRSIDELQNLEQNHDFVALRSKFRNALGTNSTQDDFNAAARDIIMAFIQAPSGRAPDTSTLPNYHAMLRAFMETVVESGLFQQRLADCEQERYETLRPQMEEMISIFDITLPQDKRDRYCRELAQALIQHQSSHTTPIVNLLLSANIPQSRVDELIESPNMGNLLTSFRKRDYSQTICDSSLYTEHSDIMIVNGLFPLDTVNNDILGIRLAHENGNHWNITIPDSGFFHSLLLPSPTASAEVRVSNTPSKSVLSVDKPATGTAHVGNSSSNRLAYERAQASKNSDPLLKKPETKTHKEARSNTILYDLTLCPQASEEHKATLLQNFATLVEKITIMKEHPDASPKAKKALEDLSSQVQSTRDELDRITLAKLSEDDYTRLNGALITVNKQYHLIKSDIKQVRRKP